MNRRYNSPVWLVVLLLLLLGCSSENMKRTEVQVPEPEKFIPQQLLSDTLSRAEMKTAIFSPNFMTNDSNAEAAITKLLERAREHYVQALNHQEAFDTTRSQDEFEYAIAILNELAYFPGIDTNQEFTDLSKSVIDDYEKYISGLDVLSPKSSIFALQEKLNQLDDEIENPEEDVQTGVVHTTTIPLVLNGHVEEYMNYFQSKARKIYEQWLWRSGKYFPMMKRVFKEEGVPEELVYLSMVESGLNPTARSWAKAVGIWQFVKGTGSLYGLTGNSWYDERRDFEKATRAAAQHLKDLYNDFQDWYLVLAAYNSGAGRVSRAIKKSKSRDFWKMRPFLPKETRNYVPQYIAASVIALDPKCYGFDIPVADPLEFDKVTVTGSIALSTLAQCAEVDATEIQTLNPEILKWCTPPGINEYTIRIPAGKTEVFNKNYQNIPEEQKRPWQIHKVKKGETLARIAKKYGLTSSMIADVNKIPLKKRLKNGQELVVPVPPMRGLASVSFPADEETKKATKAKRGVNPSSSAKGKSKLTYRIRKGDTLGHIAQLFDVRASDLRVWNDLAYGSNIIVGDTLSVWIPNNKVETYANLDAATDKEREALTAEKSKQVVKKGTRDWSNYTVQSGDNLGSIAKKYGVSVKDVQRWNGLRSNRIKAGDKLEIYTPDSGNSTTPQQNLASAKSASTQNAKTYVVKKGDTLHSIAALFGVTVKEIVSWNDIKDNQIYIGQELKINS